MTKIKICGLCNLNRVTYEFIKKALVSMSTTIIKHISLYQKLHLPFSYMQYFIIVTQEIARFISAARVKERPNTNFTSHYFSSQTMN